MPSFDWRFLLRKLVPYLLLLILGMAFLLPERLDVLRFAPASAAMLFLGIALFVVLSETLLPFLRHQQREGKTSLVLWILILLINMPLLGAGYYLLGDFFQAALPLKVEVEMDGDAERVTMRTIDLYPYTGWHVQSHYHHQGKMPYEDGSFGEDFDVISGDHGFFIDFSLQSPPPKEKGEFRVILIGGSAAQGWGGTSNDKMFYRLLGKQLGKKVRVINLAMGGSNTYQNFIALNKWAHPLEPDLILSFSGFNDLRLWEMNHSDSIYGFSPVQGYVLATRFSESPGWIKMASRYTDIFLKTDLGAIFRMFRLRELAAKADTRYREAHGFEKKEPVDGAAETFTHAVKSITRDFPGVPVWVVYQPATALDAKAYRGFREKASRVLANARPVRLFDYHERWIAGKMDERFPKALNGVHLTDRGHEIIAEWLALDLLPTLKNRVNHGRESSPRG